MELQFGVTAKTFSLYEAFKKEAEKHGWTYNEKFNRFEEDNMMSCNSLHFYSNWNKEGSCLFSFSNTSSQHKTFNLPEQWDSAIEYISSYHPNPTIDVGTAIDVSIAEIAAWKNVKPEQIRIII